MVFHGIYVTSAAYESICEVDVKRSAYLGHQADRREIIGSRNTAFCGMKDSKNYPVGAVHDKNFGYFTLRNASADHIGKRQAHGTEKLH